MKTGVGIMKKKIIVLLMTMTMVASVLAGCGADSSNVADNKKTETSSKSDTTNGTEELKEDVDATENNADASKGEDSQDVNPFLGPDGLMFASEDAVVINISGVDVPMALKRDELIALIEENNWEIQYRSVDSNAINGFTTPAGWVYAEVFEDKRHGFDNQLWMIDFSPVSFDLSKASINGVTLDKVETLKNSSNLIMENDTGYFKISIADFTTLTVTYNSRNEELEHVIIERNRLRD